MSRISSRNAPALVSDESAGGRLEPIAPANLGAQIADRLVEAIAAGRLRSGERLIESELAADLGVSRIPVREALRELESQGLLVARPHRGIRLIEFEDAWVQQLYEIRVALERVSWRHAAAVYRSEPDRLDRLDRIIGHMRIAAAGADRQAVNRADIAFHETLCEESGSPLLMTLWRAIRRHVRIIFDRETFRSNDLDAVVDQHVRLRALLVKDDAAALERELQEHVLGRLSLNIRRQPPRSAGAKVANHETAKPRGRTPR